MQNAGPADPIGMSSQSVRAAFTGTVGDRTQEVVSPLEGRAAPREAWSSLLEASLSPVILPPGARRALLRLAQPLVEGVHHTAAHRHNAARANGSNIPGL